MPVTAVAGTRELSWSLFPLEGRWGFPHRPWFDRYPCGVPHGLAFPAMRVEHLLELAAQQYPARTAILYFQTHWSYGELLERVRQVAGRLAHLGVRAGDRVLFALPNCPEFVVAWFAAHWLGAEVVHGSPLYSAKELVRLARITRPRAVFTLDLKMQATLEMTREYAVPLLFVTSLAPHLPLFLRTMYRLHGLIRRPGGAGSQTAMHPFQTLYAGGLPLRSPALTDPELPAVLQPTGGTTGSPKVAVLRHRNLLANVAQLHVMSGRMPGNETVLGVLPFFHVFGATVTMLSGIAGAATLLLQAKFDPPRVLDLCLKHHPTVAPMVPFMFTSLLGEMKRRRVRLDSLRMCLSGASALDTRVREEFLTHTDAVMCEGYGLSEAAPVTHCNPPECTRAGTIGLPMPDTDVRVVDIEAGTRDVIPGQVGELVIRGPQVMKEYLNEPAETAQTLRDGWLHTGDLVVMDEGGFFRVVDRKKDMIKSAGLNVYPSEVEAVIAQCSGVQQCAVVGEDDPLWGQRVVAWVVPRPNQHIDPVLLREHCRHDLAHYKVPREFRACKELPTNFLGKVRRRELREQAGEANLPPGPEHGPKKAA